MKLHELRPAAGSKKAPKRVGRGTGSNWGRNAGRGEYEVVQSALSPAGNE